MQNRPVIPKGEQIDNEPTGGGGFKLPGGMLSYAIAVVVISLIVSFGVNYFIGVSKTEVNKFITDTQAQVDAMSADLRASRDSIKTGLDSIPTIVDSKVTSAVSSISSRVSTMETDVSALENSVVKINNALPDSTRIRSDIDSLFSQLNTIKSDISGLKTSVGSLASTSKVDDLTKNYTALKTAFDELQKKFDALTSGGGTGGGTTPAPTGVSIIANTPNITLTPTGYTNAFNLTITNNSAKAISGGQITFTLQFVGLPVGQNVGTVLIGTPLASDYITWRTPTLTTVTNQAYYIGDFSGYILSNSTAIITINIDLADFGGSGNVFMNLLTPTISGFTSF
jgi:outer membrane murein-binding lipoprotein Lpp